MNFGKAFTFVFEDPEWITKVLITAAIGLIPVVGQFYLLGWMLDIARRAFYGEDPLVLPEMDFGVHIINGVQAMVLGLVYGLPLFIFALPIVIVPVLGTAMELHPDTLGMVLMITSLCSGLLMFVAGILISLLVPAAEVHMMVEGGSLGAGLRFKEVFGLVRAAPLAYVIALIGAGLALFAAVLIGSIACGIGIIVTMVYAQAVMGHFYGQAYAQARSQPIAA